MASSRITWAKTLMSDAVASFELRELTLPGSHDARPRDRSQRRAPLNDSVRAGKRKLPELAVGRLSYAEVFYKSRFGRHPLGLNVEDIRNNLCQVFEDQFTVRSEITIRDRL
jgi:hypothetical protein